MYQLFPECMQTLRLDAKHIMSVTMDVKDIKEPRSYAQMERFSINKNLHATGGTMLTAHKRRISISECCAVILVW